jgi:hypothetical protein
MAAVGLRVKTGKALAVALAGTAASPRALLREQVALADPAEPGSSFPYHLELEGQPKAADAAVRLCRRLGASALQRLFKSVSADERIESITVVVNTHTPPERITSPHMRAHGKEGWLFREICEQAAKNYGVEPVTLSIDEVQLDQRVLTALGAEFGRPWTADWKLAAAAAWRTLR